MTKRKGVHMPCVTSSQRKYIITVGCTDQTCHNVGEDLTHRDMNIDSTKDTEIKGSISENGYQRESVVYWSPNLRAMLM